MKYLISILAMTLVLLCLQTASASDINITDADAVINITPSAPLYDALDSTDAPLQEKFKDVFVHLADATLNFTPRTPSEDALDSTDAPLQEKFKDVFVHLADATLNFTPRTPSEDALDSTDAPLQEKFKDVFVHLADATLNFTPSAPPLDALDSAPPIIIRHVPSGCVQAPVEAIHLYFDSFMDRTSFSVAEDIVSFTGPEGSVTVSGYRWMDSDTLEVTFEPQDTPGQYEMVIGPDILDMAGNAMDQDGDLVVGEVPDDQYTASFEIVEILYWSGDITEDTTWNYKIVIVDGSITVASGVTLTIEPETIVKFSGSSSGINVQGSLDILGTSEHPVIMTSLRDDTAGGDTNEDGNSTNPAAGDWQGLTFSSATAAGLLENVQIRYANKGVHGTAGGASIELHNCILRDGNYGVYVYTPYVETELDNCLIVNNRLTGVFVRASSSHTLRNCNIVGNGFLGSGWNSASIHLGAATLTVDNTIVAFNKNGLHHSGDIPSVVVRNSDFYNPAGQEIIWDGDPGEPQLDQNGNINSDPLFVDRWAGNYELDDGSPCIDSGRGIQAPAEDFLGRFRYDDPGMPNVGTGYPSYVDIGAFERQEDTAAGDLAVTYVSNPDPEFVSVGDTFTVEWTVVNRGLLDCTGPWQDKVYLSNDPYISPDDLILATRVHNGTLSPGDTYTELLTATVPSTSGPKYILVHTNANRVFPEANETNNVESAWQVLAVDVPLLELDSPVTATLAAGEWNYYRFEGTSGNTVRFTLNADSASGSTGLYIRAFLPPTIEDYDAAGAIYNQPDQEAKLPEPLEGTYYVGIYGKNLPGGATDYTLSARLTDLGIEAVSPNIIGTAGNATIEIVGDNFLPDDEIYLLAPDEATQLTPVEVYYVDPSHIFATFNLTTVDIGVYDVVVVTAESEIATLANAIEITQGGGPDFHASLSMPGIARPGRVINVRVDYSNKGINDLASPLLTLVGPEDCEWQAPNSNEWVTGSKFRLIALSTSGPANILRAGQSESIEVKVRVPVRGESLQLSLYSLGARLGDGSEKPINWSLHYPSPGMAEYAKYRLGVTGKEYVSRLGNIAAYLATWEGLIYDVELLEQYLWEWGGEELPEAVGFPGGDASSASTDTVGSNGASLDSSTDVTILFWDGNDWVIASDANVHSEDSAAIVIHGWAGSPDNDWVKDMARALSSTGDFDCVLAVDWRTLAYNHLTDPFATKSARNIPYVAEHTYQILSALGINPAKTHIIGHSHGAHVAGLIGENYGGSIARITALDASEEVVHRQDVPRSWGQSSARFVDFYKTSRLCGGETSWGHDNFLLVEEGDTWGVGGLCEGDHSYGQEWFTQTILSRGTNDLKLGYEWNKDSWKDAKSKLADFGGKDGPWKGLIRGIFEVDSEGRAKNLNVLECFSEGTDKSVYTKEWLYPGAWPGGQDDARAIRNMVEDIAAAVEMNITEVAPQNGEQHEGFYRWMVGQDDAKVTYTVINNADNPSIEWEKRGEAQNKIVDRIWLSKDEEVDKDDIDVSGYKPKCVRGRKGYWHEAIKYEEGAIPEKLYKGPDFLGCRSEESNKRDFTLNLDLPSRDEVISKWPEMKTSWPEGEVSPSFYLIVDAGSSQTDDKAYEGELYSQNNCKWIVVQLYDGLCAYATAHPQESTVSNANDVVRVRLDGSHSGPKDWIDKYEWSVGGNQEIINHSFGVGKHKISLTVTNESTTEKDTAEVWVIVKLEDKPIPLGNSEDSGSTDVFRSYTPEDKFGPAGYDAPDTSEGSEVRYIPAGQTLNYRIEFWNKEDAPVPTQDAVIEDTLDSNIFEFSTFEFTRIGFLEWDMSLPGGQAIDTRIDCRPEMNIAVEVTATFDPDTGKIRWWFHCIDPLTGDWPEDPMAGFLPPFNPETGFEIGWVEFQVKPKADLATGTQIPNQAFVEFDFAGDLYDHPAPKEGPWINTIDAAPPESNITEAVLDGNEIKLNWTGSDEGSGIKDYTIYVSEDDMPYMPWLTHTTDTSAVFTGDFGHVYSFYSTSRDNVGNVELAPEEPDVTVSIAMENQPPVADANGPYTGVVGSSITFNGTGSYDPDGTIVSYEWDLDDDGEFDDATGAKPSKTWDAPYSGNISLKVTDNNGTTDVDSTNLTVEEEAVDIIPPSVTNPTAIPSSIVADGIQESQLNVTVTDESGIASVTVDLTDIGGSPTQEMDNILGTDVYTVNTTATLRTAPDTYELQVNATDIYGNSNTSVSIALTVTEAEEEDTIPPTIESVTLDAYTTIPDATIHVTVEATDNVGVTSVTADGVDLEETGSIWEGDIIAPSTTGDYTLTIRAEDAAGNFAETTVDYSVVKPSGSIGIGVDPRLTTVNANDTAIINITLVSTENFDDIAYVYLTTEGVYPGYEANLTWFNWTSKYVKVPAGATVKVPLKVNIPAGESGYKVFYAKLESKKWTPTAMDTGVLYII